MTNPTITTTKMRTFGVDDYKLKPKSFVILPADSHQWHIALSFEDNRGDKHYFIGRGLKLNEFQYQAGIQLIRDQQLEAENDAVKQGDQS